MTNLLNFSYYQVDLKTSLEVMEAQPRDSMLQKWRRFVLRLWDRQQWHFRGLVLWLCARSYLRYLPFPYPSISSTDQWVLQAQSMVGHRTLISGHHQAAVQAGAFTAANLIEMSRFRDRCGWKMAFLEDSLLSGFLALRANKGQKDNLKAQALAEAKTQAQKIAASGQREDAARALIGPRGGLPSLRADIIKLAALLQVEVDARDTVPVLQKKVRPMVDILKNKMKYDSKASSSKETPTAPSEFMTPPMPKRASPAPAESTKSSPSTTSVTLDQVDQRVQDLLSQQEQRFQAMLLPVLQHVINTQGNAAVLQPHIAGADLPEKSDDEMSGRSIELIPQK